MVELTSSEGTGTGDELQARLESAFGAHVAGERTVADLGYRAVLAAEPNHPAALHMLGVLRLQQGLLAEALGLITRALQHDPRNPSAMSNRALVFLEMARPDEALLDIDAALRIDPQHADALVHRATALCRLAREQEARSCLAYLNQLNPERGSAALQAFERDLTRGLPRGASNQTLAAILSNRGVMLTQSGGLLAADADFRRALRLEPNSAEYLFNQSIVALLQGNFDRGWDGYEARFAARKLARPGVATGAPEWDGRASLSDKTILVLPEQGLGDTIQFLRYLPILAAGAKKVIIAVPPPLDRLCKEIPGIAVVTGLPERADYDVVCALLSLPWLLGTTLATIPAEVPYLFAPDSATRVWRARLGKAIAPRIGVTWTGNPEHPLDGMRSLPLSRLLEILPDEVEIIALQKEMTTADQALMETDGRIRRLEGIGDFADTAAIIKELDLVVAVDTSVAHLAGALATPLWLLLPFAPDWRWLQDRSDSPWYPTARLFRQTRIGVWDDALTELSAHLLKFAGG